MAKSMYAYVREAWKKPAETGVKELQWQRMQEWRREGSVVRLEHPTRIDRARNLGYKAKQGIAVVRVTYKAGRAAEIPVRPRPAVCPDGEEPHHPGEKSSANCRGTGFREISRTWKCSTPTGLARTGSRSGSRLSLWTATTRPFRPTRPLLAAKPAHRGRAERGKTSAGGKGRGMMTRGRGTEKTRPSIRSHGNLGK